MDTPQNDVALNLAKVNARIAAAAKAEGRDPADVHLVAVSKTIPVERIRLALSAGQRRFGENRVQEAKEKWPKLIGEIPEIELHLIGPLQTNKARDAVQLCHVIQSVDRKRLVDAL